MADLPSDSDAASTPSSLSADDALAKLEDHRCAICQKILINACRIDCGHTFCRHCLNTDRETRSDSGKATCFICDAAVTEISQNAEIDKEIDELYAVLSTDEKLSRTRAKSERKEEEEDFAKEPKGTKKVCSKQKSSESIASGDASYNMADNEGQASWSCTYSNNGHFMGESSTECGGTPSCYCGHGQYTFWSDEQDQPEEECLCDHERFDDGSNSQSQSECSGCMDDNDNGISEYPNSPFPQPIVIHHTVQHVYHTFEAGTRIQSHTSSLQSLQSQARHEWNGRQGEAHTFRQREQFCRPMTHHDYRFQSHYRSPGPTYSSAGFYNQYQNAVHPQMPAFASCSHAPLPTSPFCYASGYPASSFNSYSPSRRPYQCVSNGSDDDEGGNEPQYFDCENLCEYHQTMHDHGLTYETASESHEEQNFTTGETHLDAGDNDESGDSNYEAHLDEFADDQNPQFLTFNVSIPISNLGTRGRFSRQRNPHYRHLSQNSDQ